MGGGQSVRRLTCIVDGPVAFRMARLEAARADTVGLEISTFPLLAARLTGGFCRVADHEAISTGVAAALAAGGFADLEDVRSLPGTVRAVVDTLRRVWLSDLDLTTLASRSARLADMALVERRLAAMIPAGSMLPRDLRDAAIGRVRFAPALLGDLTLDRILYVDPIWRPLLGALAAHIPIRWVRPVATREDEVWFPGERVAASTAALETVEADLCADPHAEIVEALRWARALLSSGTVQAADIGIVAASTPAWDEHMLVLSRDAGLPVHFSHGVPALNTREGQACAALADVLTNGLSQDRVRRLLRWTSTSFSQVLPKDWAAGLPRRAGLFSVAQWRQALTAARPQRQDGVVAESALLPLLEMLEQGPTRPEEAGNLVLPPASLGLWKEALRLAPPAAVAMSLEKLRVRDDRDPGNSIVWGPAAHLVGAPRPYTRLLGLVARAWPRSDSEDPLLPDHIVTRRDLVPVSRTERDRDVFACLAVKRTGQITISRSLRSPEGTLQCTSALWPASATLAVRPRARIPEHAFGETDRIFARPGEAGQLPQVKASRNCWRNWRDEAATPHDGLVRADHPAVWRALTRLHSPTSLRRLVRDPLGFLWRYALDMGPLPLAQRPLAFDAMVFGELVHELLKRTVDLLEPDPGLVRASRDRIEQALEQAVVTVREAWPLERAVPPALLWSHALEEAAQRSLRALTIDDAFQAGTRSWTEFAFGMTEQGNTDGPWSADQEVLVGKLPLKLSGRIDRIDVAAGGAAIRLSDYKTGRIPEKADRLVLDRGREVQRVLYAIAARQLYPDVRQLASRLVYLREGVQPFTLRGTSLEDAAADLTRYLDIACDLLSAGKACPGPDAQERYNELKLALPADINGYFRRKGAAFAALHRDLSPLWSRP